MKVAVLSHFPPCKSGYASYTSLLIDMVAQVNPSYSFFILGCNESHSTAILKKREFTVKNLWCVNRPLGIFKILITTFRIRPDVFYVYYPIQMYTSEILETLNATLVMPLLLLLFKLMNIPIVLDLDDIVGSASPQLKSKKGMIRHLISLFTFRVLDASASVFSLRNRNMIKTLKNDYKINLAKVRYIPHGVETTIDKRISKDDAKRILDINQKKVILFFGFISRYKGIDQLIKAMPRVLEEHPDAFLLVVGDYFNPADKSNPSTHKYLPYLKDLIATLGISKNSRFDVKYVPEKDIAIYFSAADVICFPYITSNISASGVLSKAMAYGKPIITSSSPWFEDIIDGINGLVTPMAEHRMLADAIIKLLANEKLCEFLENNVAITARESSWYNVAAKLSFIFQEISARK